jgi:aminoglycoside phosphotransferase family enzyme/predicted kinase
MNVKIAASPTGLVFALRERLHADTGRPVELKETHISWVLLTDGLAYKLKKPVKLPFVDFSTPALRKHFCEEELRLNSRLAPFLYLGVVPVCGTPDAPRIGGQKHDAPIDYAVCMRRFPQGALLSEQLAAAAPLEPALDRFADRLALFHGEAPRASGGTPFGLPQQVVQPALDVLQQLRPACSAERLDVLRRWIDRQVPALNAAWLARRRAGAIRACHGDLHLDNVARIGADVVAFDCIEFDPSLQWIDVMSDVAFLIMDLKARGRDDLAFRFLDKYLQLGGDYGGVRVLRFYEVYRALVRALVAHLRSRAGVADAPTSPDYLACAERLTAGDRGARLLITYGLSGSGKSTVAGQLLEAAGAIRVRSDVERKRLFGLGALQRSAATCVDIYTQEATRRTFDRLRDCAHEALRAGYPVIVDAAFLRRVERRAFRGLASELGVPFSILHCRASEAALRRRVAARGEGGDDASEADLAVLERQLQSGEPLDESERAAVLEVMTDEPVDAEALAGRWLT